MRPVEHVDAVLIGLEVGVAEHHLQHQQPGQRPGADKRVVVVGPRVLGFQPVQVGPVFAKARDRLRVGAGRAFGGPPFERVDRRLVVADRPQDARGDDLGARLRVELGAPLAAGAVPHGVTRAEPAALDLEHREPLVRIRRQRRAADAVEQVPARRRVRPTARRDRRRRARPLGPAGPRVRAPVWPRPGPYAGSARRRNGEGPAVRRRKCRRRDRRAPYLGRPLPCSGNAVPRRGSSCSPGVQGLCPEPAPLPAARLQRGVARFPRHVQPEQRQQRRRRQVVAHVARGPSWWPARWRRTAPATRRRCRRSCR